MDFFVINHSFKYESEKVARLFLPFEKFNFLYEKQRSDSYILTEISENGENVTALAEILIDGKILTQKSEVSTDAENFKGECERCLGVNIYKVLSRFFSYSPEWGILTGIRPVGYLSRLMKKTDKAGAKKFFGEKMLVDSKKIELIEKCQKSEAEIISLSTDNSFSLYISIPFCPTRCKYCSFVSHSVENSLHLVPQYVEYLCKELKYTANIAKTLNLRLETVYIGGGTPTSLEAEDLDKIMKTVSAEFDLSTVREYTVEAGRPDTVTIQKLNVIKQNGATRISINPQTLNDNVLENIGRRHTAKMFYDSFDLARKAGFDNINTDLIAGLEGDTLESFKNTVDGIIKLSPESVTVHSLSVKRGAALTKESKFHNIAMGEIAAEMVAYANRELEKNGIFAYYMYRQGKTVGNLENVGYSVPKKQCLYNIYIMDETHTILACGASATTKLRQVGGEYIERIFNYKYPYEYINGFEEMLNRKKRVIEFYEVYGKRDKSNNQ